MNAIEVDTASLQEQNQELLSQDSSAHSVVETRFKSTNQPERADKNSLAAFKQDAHQSMLSETMPEESQSGTHQSLVLSGQQQVNNEKVQAADVPNRPQKGKFNFSDPLFKLAKPVQTIYRTSEWCPSCPQKVPNQLDDYNVSNCEFCGHQVCQPCLKKTRKFPLPANNDDQYNIGSICKLCDKKFYIYQNFISKLKHLQQEQEIINRLQKKQQKLEKKLTVKQDECELYQQKLADVIHQKMSPEEQVIEKLTLRQDKLTESFQNRQYQMHENEKSLVLISLQIQEVCLQNDKKKRAFYSLKKQVQDTQYQINQVKARSMANSMISSDQQRQTVTTNNNNDGSLAGTDSDQNDNESDDYSGRDNTTMQMQMNSSLDTLHQNNNNMNNSKNNLYTLKEQYRRAVANTSNKNMNQLMQQQQEMYDDENGDLTMNAAKMNKQKQQAIIQQRQRIAAMRQMEQSEQQNFCCCASPALSQPITYTANSTHSNSTNNTIKGRTKSDDKCIIF